MYCIDGRLFFNNGKPQRLSADVINLNKTIHANVASKVKSATATIAASLASTSPAYAYA